MVPLRTAQAARLVHFPCRVWPSEEHPCPLPEGAWCEEGDPELSCALSLQRRQLGAVLTQLGSPFGPSCPLAQPSRHFVPIPCLWEGACSQLKSLMS